MVEFFSMTGFEIILSIGFALSVIVTICSAFMVFSNESDEIKDKPLLREIMGGLDVFVTSKYLNKTGKAWQIPFLIGIAYIVFWTCYFYW